MEHSFANGNGPNGTGLGGKPPEIAAGEVTHWTLVTGDSPGYYAS